jgi:hypothetical protein
MLEPFQTLLYDGLKPQLKPFMLQQSITGEISFAHAGFATLSKNKG